jgi:SAM-dependent methyltransferase
MSLEVTGILSDTSSRLPLYGTGRRDRMADSTLRLNDRSGRPSLWLQVTFRRQELALFLASMVTLYFELLIIRYVSSEVRVFANLKNLPLVACFFGTGLGMLLGNPKMRFRALFPAAAALLFLLTRFALPLHLSFGDMSWNYGLGSGGFGSRFLSVIRFLGVGLGYSLLIVIVFRVLGGHVGQYMKRLPSLKGYGINLCGGLAGMALFSLLAFWHLGPAAWLLLGFLMLAPLVAGDRLTLVMFAVVVGIVAIPEPDIFWSPYNRIELTRLSSPEGWPRASAYALVANHVWYQWLVDLSPEFLERYPTAEPNSLLLRYYELPYQIVPRPQNVLILGAGTGNDVAGALRHGAQHVDAVEIDPVILEIGRRYHPEHPYDSPRVTVYVGDARSFLKKTTTKYDLIVFGFLDSSTLLSSFSSLRLDNYVYTVESFENAKARLADQGTLVLSFATSRGFATDRLYATLGTAFGTPPAAYFTGFWVNSILLIEGGARNTKFPQLVDASGELRTRTTNSTTLLATDNWPFLYLTNRSVPGAVLVAAALFFLMAWVVLRSANCLSWRTSLPHLHFFSLGVGFLLLETKAVTQLSLLFGETWIVNSVVIGAFLTMALAANVLAGTFRVSVVASYIILLVLLIADFWFPYSMVNGLSASTKFLVGGGWAALPVFFSGIVFSSSLQRFDKTAEALGVNLFGAVLGGLLENSVMIGGTPILKALALGMYAASAVALFRTRSRIAT